MSGRDDDTVELFYDVPRGVIRRRGRDLGLEDQAMPRAAFMGLDEIRGSRLLAMSPDKIFLGVIGGQTKMINGEPHVLGGHPIGIGDDRHVFMGAGSRAGKGRSTINPTLLSYEGSVLAIDPKGELASITARHRREVLGQHVMVLDPFGTTSGYAAQLRVGFNPMGALAPDSPTLIEDAGLIADGLVVREDGGSKDPHWDESARAFIEGVVVHVATAPEHEGRRHLGTVQALIMGSPNVTGKDGMARVEAEMRTNEAADGFVQDAAEDFFSKPEDERGSVLSTARRHLRFLAYPSLRASVSGPVFDLGTMKREKVTIYLCLPAMRMGTCNRWLRMVINMALAAFEREPAKPKPPVLMVLDEFATLGHMRTIEDAAGLMAGFGVKLWTIVQDLGQLKSLYKERWQTFLGNAGAVQFFGNSDLTTLEYIAKRLGTTSVIVRNQSEVGDRDQTRTDRRGSSWTVQTPGLLTVDEAGRLFGRDDPAQRQLVLLAGYDPMILQRVKYDSHALFRGKFDAPG